MGSLLREVESGTVAKFVLPMCRVIVVSGGESEGRARA